MKNLIKNIFDQDERIRYVAILKNDSLISEQRNNIQNASSSDSDKYEELLVNPVLLKLATQRGNIDCGGLDFLLVKYGNFYQWISPVVFGHISICIDLTANPFEVIYKVQPLLKLPSCQGPDLNEYLDEESLIFPLSHETI